MSKIFRRLPLAILAAFSLLAAAPLGGILPVAQALAASQQKVTAGQLIANTIKGLAAINAVEKKNAAARKLTKAEVRLLKAVAQSAGAIATLEKARKARKPKAMSKATKEATVAIARLQSVYSAGHFKEKQLGLAVKAISANWSSYLARFATVKPDKRKVTATEKELAALKEKVAKLEKQMRALEARMAGNPGLARDYARLMAQLQRLLGRGITLDSYDLALLDLAVIYGWYDGYGWILMDYYPDYYGEYVSYRDDFIDADSYWAGYYDGYYASWPADYYEMEFTVTTDVTVTIEETYSSEVTAELESDYESFASSVEEEAGTTDIAEATADDIADTGESEEIADIAGQSEDESADVAPTAEELTDIEAGDAPIDEGPVGEDGDSTDTGDDDGTDQPADETTTPDDGTDQPADESTTPDDGTDQPADDGAATDESADQSVDDGGDQSVDGGGAETEEPPPPEEPTYEEPPPEEPTYEEPPPEEPTYEEPPAPEEPADDSSGGGGDCTDESPC
jgi:hypothetical protein